LARGPCRLIRHRRRRSVGLLHDCGCPPQMPAPTGSGQLQSSRTQTPAREPGATAGRRHRRSRALPRWRTRSAIAPLIKGPQTCVRSRPFEFPVGGLYRLPRVGLDGEWTTMVSASTPSSLWCEA
jgi:hypothetical protein